MTQSTRVIAFQIDSASAKISFHEPADDKKDIVAYNTAWTGTVVKEERWVEAKPSPYCPKDIETPSYIQDMLDK